MERYTFSKAERLCSKKDIGRLISNGKWGSVGCLRYCWIRRTAEVVSGDICQAGNTGVTGATGSAGDAGSGLATGSGNAGSGLATGSGNAGSGLAMGSGDAGSGLATGSGAAGAGLCAGNVPAIRPGSSEAATLSRIMVSVPKRLFKRAVKRNLLKRRIREAYRLQKSLLGGAGVNASGDIRIESSPSGDTPVRPGFDILFQYCSPEIADFETIFGDVAAILRKIAK